MARIPAIATISPKQWQVIQGPVAVEIGGTAGNNPSGLGATRASVGLVEANVELNPNIETAVLMSDQLFNPHTVLETAWAYQVTMSLRQKTIWNFALALTYDQSAVTGSSMLTLDGQEPSPYRCMRIISEGAPNLADGDAVTQNTDLWKVKIVPSGAIVSGRTTPTAMPIIAHAVCNSSDKVGVIALVDATHSKPNYEPPYE